jgi:hypothetical protein
VLSYLKSAFSKSVAIYLNQSIESKVGYLLFLEVLDSISRTSEKSVQKANLIHFTVSNNLVPLTVIKGAGHEFIPLPQGENATTADFHSIRTKTESPAHFTSGFYKIEAGPARPALYNFEETKYVLNGQIDVLVCYLLQLAPIAWWLQCGKHEKI